MFDYRKRFVKEFFVGISLLSITIIIVLLIVVAEVGPLDLLSLASGIVMVVFALTGLTRERR